MTGGVGLHGLRGQEASAAGHLGVRADALFLRRRNIDGAIGPYAEALTVAFSDLQLGGGVSAQMPGLESSALVGSLGGYARASDASGSGWRPGVSAGLFFGIRSFNFHSAYGMANGLFVQGRLGLGDTRQADVLFGAQVDLAMVALPFLLAWGALR